MFFSEDKEVVPWGLAYRYYQQGEAPSPDEIFKANKALWEKISLPDQDIDSLFYENFFYRHTLKYYADSLLRRHRCFGRGCTFGD